MESELPQGRPNRIGAKCGDSGSEDDKNGTAVLDPPNGRKVGLLERVAGGCHGAAGPAHRVACQGIVGAKQGYGGLTVEFLIFTPSVSGRGGPPRLAGLKMRRPSNATSIPSAASVTALCNT